MMQSSLLLLLQVSGQQTAAMSSSFVTLLTAVLQSPNPKAIICICVQLVFVPTAVPAHGSELFGHRSAGIGGMKCLQDLLI